jgi:Holliday junction DNA helicase RuvB
MEKDEKLKLELEERFISTKESNEDYKYAIRPNHFKDFIGQNSLKKELKVYIKAARKREEPLDHVLLAGPPGLGKTTLSYLIASEMKVNMKITSGPAIERQGDIAAILTNLSSFDILFIDEIHRLNRNIEEMLYSAMEEYEIDIVVGKGPSAKSIRIDVPKFTLVGATTRSGDLTSPLRDRFGIIKRLEYYSIEELKVIILNSAIKLKTKIDDEAAYEIASRSRGTPRIALRILRRVRDFAQEENDNLIDIDISKKALDLLDIDKMGLDNIDKKILLTLIEKFEGKPVALHTLSSAIGEESDNIYDVYEPYLIQVGFLNRTNRGRIATKKAYEHFKLENLYNQK